MVEYGLLTLKIWWEIRQKKAVEKCMELWLEDPWNTPGGKKGGSAYVAMRTGFSFSNLLT